MALNGFDPALRRTALVVAAGSVMTVLDTTIVNVAVRVLGRDLHAGVGTVQWVLTGYVLALSATLPITGWAVRRFGTRPLWLTSLVLFIVGSVLCGLAWSPPSLIAFRVIQGVGGGLLLPVGQAMLARAAGPDRMGRAMAVVSVPAMLAPALGPVLGGWLLDGLSWRWMFLVNVPVCVAALVLAVRLLPHGAERSGSAEALDRVGLVLLAPGLAVLLYGLSQLGEDGGHPDVRVVAGLVGGLALLVAFAVHALRRGERALVDLRLFSERGFAAACAALFCYTAAMFGVMIMLPLREQVVRGGGVLNAGLAVAPLGAGAIVTMLVAGRLTDRLGGRVPALCGLVLVLAGIGVLGVAGPGTSPAALAATVFVAGLGHGLVTPSIMASAYRRLPRSAVPAATTAANIVLRAGSAVGAAATAVVLQLLLPSSGALFTSGGGELASAFSGSFRWAFGVAAVAVLPTLLLSRPDTGRPADIVGALGAR